MKRFSIYITATLSIFLLLFAACNKKLLDPSNPNGLTGNDVWKDPKLIEAYVNGLYNDVQGWDDSNTYDNITDEARNNYPGSTPNNILLGQWDASSNPMDNWNYTGVRKINEFFARIDGSPVPEARKTVMKGEARFLRALIYFDMVKRYGGVPIITTAQALNSDLNVKRATTTETFSFIEKELETAFGELDETKVRGRASKWAAKALRARALLFAASPLYNAGNDQGLWKAAADAGREVIISQKYDLYPDLQRIWLEKGNQPEALFEVQYHMPEKYHGWDAMAKPLRLANNDAGQRSPLQELVNAFPMKNGKMITEAGSGYDPANPYVGRDNRFYADIAYNGAKIKGTTTGPPVHEITLDIYKGGQDFDAEPTTQIYNTITGYYTVKAIDPDNTIYTGGYGSVQPWIEIRYAEVLLNYAEAQNEYLSAPDASVFDALNKLRKRAGITTDLVPGTLSKIQMRELIRNERFVELCFEGKRYWDLRRWKLATTVLNGTRGTGVIITKQPNGTFTYDYQPVDAQPNVFLEKMYFMPIQQSEISKNKNLEQTTGWK